MEDIEALEQLGFCPGIENYSRYLDGRKFGEAPPCLLDYFPEDFLTIIDESHITVPQIGAMYHGDRSRKKNLVDFGFRLPSAMDNRPLNFQEFLDRSNQTLFVSATPGQFELERCQYKFTEQIIRPTGLLDPRIIVKTSQNQIDDLYGEMIETIKNRGRILITTLTKKMAEELSAYYLKLNLKVTYLHSDIDSLERMDVLNKLREGIVDVLIGINLLREGLDLPEVKLVAVMDADKEGFLRSRTSLIQIVGRAARNHESKVIFYADRTTAAMAETLRETKRRRKIQEAYNQEHGITPRTVHKPIPKNLMTLHGFLDQESGVKAEELKALIEKYSVKSMKELSKLMRKKHKEMKKAAKDLAFEKAVVLRDEIKELRTLEFVLKEKV